MVRDFNDVKQIRDMLKLIPSEIVIDIEELKEIFKEE